MISDCIVPVSTITYALLSYGPNGPTFRTSVATRTSQSSLLILLRCYSMIVESSCKGGPKWPPSPWTARSAFGTQVLRQFTAPGLANLSVFTPDTPPMLLDARG